MGTEMVEKPMIPIPIPQPPRRPRVREVSSRFMSSLTTPSSSCDLIAGSSRCTPSKPVPMTPAGKESRSQLPRSRSVQRERSRDGEIDERRDEVSVRRSDGSIGMRHEGNVREVRSRFLSSVVPSPSLSSSICGDVHGKAMAVTPMPKEFQLRMHQGRLRSVQKPRQQDTEGDENRPEMNVRGWDSSIGMQVKPRSAVKLFRDSGDAKEERLRVDTPAPYLDVKYRRSNSTGMEGSVAARVLQYNGTPLPGRGLGLAGKVSIRACSPKAAPVERCSVGMEAGANAGAALGEIAGVESHGRRRFLPGQSDNPHLQNSATPDGRTCKSNSGDSLKISTPSCARSLDFPFTRQEQSLFHAVDSDQKSSSLSFKSSLDFGKSGSACLPPVPHGSKMGIDVKRKKGSNNQEPMLQLRLLHNRYLQWRYANARAEVAMMVQKRESEKLLYSVGPRIWELRDSVKMKRAEVETLRRLKTLSTILDAQMPHLDEWSYMEGDYSFSLLGTVEALLNASSQLPLHGIVKYDAQEMTEVMNLAVEALQLTFLQVQSFIQKAEQVNSRVSELARVYVGERASVDECGELLQDTFGLQIEECSLRGLLMQVHASGVVNTKKNDDNHHDIGK
ncbi:hypothetical protein Droror1_Dr00001761 [Drosera rotundifolia]